ncbi:Os12g0539800, partial [Oryza sativa Japonica Group]
EWLRRRCYCFVRSCCYKRDYPVGTEEPAQEQRRLVQIRSKTLLSEVLRGIGANEARYSCRAVADGYVGFAEATVYGARGVGEPFVVRAQGISAIRPCDAEESAAHALISVIKKECSVEFDDTNWFDMNRYHVETERLKRALGRARKKCNTLAKKARLLEIGWDRALDSLGSVNQICDDICSFVLGGPDADDLSHREVGVFYDVHRLGEYAESFVDEGLANLTSVAARYI